MFPYNDRKVFFLVDEFYLICESLQTIDDAGLVVDGIVKNADWGGRVESHFLSSLLPNSRLPLCI